MGAYRVIQISDTHLAPGFDAIDRNFEALAAFIRREKPDLVIHTGDVTRDAPGTPSEFGHAAACLKEIDAPLYLLPGNHDIGDNPNDSGVAPASPVTEPLAERFREVFGHDRWTIDAGGWRLIGLNAQVFGSGFAEEEAQWSWLADELAGNAPVALFLHKPLFLESPDEPTGVAIRYAPAAARARLLSLTRGVGLRAIGSGHVHQARQLRCADVLHAWAPAAAFVLPDALQEPIGEKFCGVLDWRFGADGAVDCAAIRIEGLETLDLTTIKGFYPSLD